VNIFKKFRIKYIFFGSFFLFMLIVFFIIIFVSYHFSVKQIVQTTTDHQQKNLELISEDIQDKLQSLNAYSIMLTRQQRFREIMKVSDDQYDRANATSSLTRDFSNIIYSVPDLHSIEIYMKSPPFDDIHYPVRYGHLEKVDEFEWIKKLENINSAWLGERKVKTIAGEQSVISLGRKIHSTRGTLEAVLILNIDPYVMQGWLRNYGEDSNLVLLDATGTIISSTSYLPIGNLLYEELIEKKDLALNTEDLHKQKILYDGKEQIIAKATMSPVNWTLMEITPFDEITQGTRVMVGSLILIGILSIFIALIGTFYLTNRFTEPIIKLTNVMSNFRLKENYRLPTDYNNEFGQLFNGFHELIERGELLYHSLIEQHQRQREAEIKALQANINPHFLYNTLDQLNWSAIENGNDDISRMLELLGKMLRIGLSKGESIISIDNELKYLDYYLQIQKIQFEDRIDYKIDVPKHLLGYYIPKLTFQPFVENAIIHGFQDSRVGKIVIKIEENNNSLLCQILDNGIGCNSFESNKRKMDTGGYGIQNVKERLDVYFGQEASVNVVNREEESGTAVFIFIPKVLDKSSFQRTMQQTIIKNTSYLRGDHDVESGDY
jgi:two-component system sensor histidine kinase YesM